jgi:hypothetical protein
MRILARERSNPLGVADAKDFLLEDCGAVAAQSVIDGANTTPYCFDPIHGRILFVEVPADVDLSGAPFLYDAQFERAQRVFAMPIDDFISLGEALPDPEDLMLIYSTGRCGSTLLASALNELGAVRVFSEPDIFTQIAQAGCPTDARTREVLVKTLRSCLRVLCRSGQQHYVVKFRSVVIELFELMAHAMPRARNIFMYRDAIGFARSTARMMEMELDNWSVDARGLRGWQRLVPSLGRFQATPELVSASRLLAHLWAGSVVRYIETYRLGLWACAVHYEDLCRDPMSVLDALRASCSLPVSSTDAPEVAFGRDSQAGTSISRKSLRARRVGEIQGRHELQISSHLAEISDGLTVDIMLPGTIQ